MIEKIEQLKKEFKGGEQESQETIAWWADAVKRNNLLIDLKKHDGIKFILSGIDQEISAIHNKLLTDRKMSAEGRMTAFNKLDMYQWFKGLFTMAEGQNKAIEKEVEYQLSDEK